MLPNDHDMQKTDSLEPFPIKISFLSPHLTSQAAFLIYFSMEEQHNPNGVYLSKAVFDKWKNIPLTLHPSL